jgi:hypothetical protein
MRMILRDIEFKLRPAGNAVPPDDIICLASEMQRDKSSKHGPSYLA